MRIRFFLQFLECHSQVRHRLPAALGTLVETAENHPLEVARQPRDHAARWFRRFRQDRRECRHLCRTVERAAARDHFVEHGTEGKDIGSRVRRFSLDLFGSHVSRGAQDRPFLGLRALRSLGAVCRELLACRIEASRLGQLREAEIQNLDGASVADHDVRWLDVAMQNPGGVRRRQRICNLHRVLQAVRNRQSVAGKQLGQRRARDVLHRDEVDTLVLPDVVDRDDVRMIERGGGSGLVDEALSALFADRSVVPEQLDGDGPSEAHVDRTVDDAHAAFTDRRQYLVMRQRLRRHRRDRQHETLSLVGRFASYLGSNLISALIFSRRSRIALISASSSQAPSAASS